jgi:hypothetical protein
MADTLKANYETSNGTTEIKILDGAGSDITYTILSITFCNTHASTDHTFDLFLDDIAGRYGTADGHFYIYQTQSLPALSTFIHSDKFIIFDDDELVFALDASGTDVDISISYLEQT